MDRVFTAPAPAQVRLMKPWRIVLVFALIAFIAFGHLYDIVKAKEHWPFSYYPMYARVEKPGVQQLLALYGKLRYPDGRTIDWLTSSRYVPPLNEGRLRVILMAAWRGADREKKAKQVMRDYMRVYESRRIAGLHNGPPMEEIYLYDVTWKLRPDGNRQSKPSKAKQLLKLSWQEVEQSSRKGMSVPAQRLNFPDDP